MVAIAHSLGVTDPLRDETSREYSDVVTIRAVKFAAR
jgi:hypothetical protein